MSITEITLYGAFAALAGVVASLFVGIFSMVRGGDFNRRYGNVIMRVRVGSQALAVLFLTAAVLTRAI